jgi:hypothetical protein
MRMRRILPFLAVASLLLSQGATAAVTPQGPAFGLRAVGNPKLGYFVYAAKGGVVEKGGIWVTNTGDQVGDVKIYSADATTGSTTGTVYLTDATPNQVGRWIVLPTATYTLKPGERKLINFTVNIPANSAAGQYVGGLVAETVRQVASPKSGQKANVQIKVRDLSIVAVQVNIPGPQVAQFTITSATVGGSKGHQQVFIHVANSGNILGKPTGQVTISKASDVSAAALETIPFRMDTFLPHTAIDYPVQLKTALPPGDYVASVKLSYSAPSTTGGTGTTKTITQTASAAPSFTISKQSVQQVFQSSKASQVALGVASPPGRPIWQYAAAGGVALLLLIAVFWLVYSNRRLKRRTAEVSAGQPPAPATAPVATPAAPVAATPVDTPAFSPVAPTPVAPTSAAPVSVTPVPPAPSVTPVPPAPASSPTATSCGAFHYWVVDWDHPQVGIDGLQRYPHRCRNCGTEVLATDISDATTQADRA